MATFLSTPALNQRVPRPVHRLGPSGTQTAALGPEAGAPDTAPNSDPRPATPAVGSPGGKAGSGMVELQLFVSLFLAALCKWLHLNVT